MKLDTYTYGGTKSRKHEKQRQKYDIILSS